MGESEWAPWFGRREIHSKVTEYWEPLLTILDNLNNYLYIIWDVLYIFDFKCSTFLSDIESDRMIYFFYIVLTIFTIGFLAFFPR